MKYVFFILGMLFLLVLWFLILFNPLIISICYGNFLYLFLYLMLIPEIIVGVFVTKFIASVLDM